MDDTLWAVVSFIPPHQLCLSPSRREGALSRLLSAGVLAVPAPWPAAGPTLALFKFLLGPANAPFSGHLLFGILDPADELVAGQRRDVLPGIECRGAGDQRLAQVSGKLVYRSTRHSRAAHKVTVPGPREPYQHLGGPIARSIVCHRN